MPAKPTIAAKIWTVYSFLTWYDVYFVHDGEKPDVIAIA